MRKSTRTEISFRCKQQPGVIFSAVQRSVHAIDNLNILVSKTQRSSLRTPWKLIDGKSRKIEVINRNSQVSIYHQLMMVIKKRLSASLIGYSGWWQEMVPKEFVSIPFIQYSISSNMASAELSGSSFFRHLQCRDLHQYLGSLPSGILDRLYNHPAICLAVFRWV